MADKKEKDKAKKDKVKQPKLKEFNYFGLFSEMGNSAVEAVKVLREMVSNPGNIEKKLEQIHAIEHDADSKYHMLISALTKAFITPIDREDIMAMARSVDDVIDAIEDLGIRFYMLNIKTIRPHALEFVEIISNCCTEVKKALVEFQHFKKSKTINDHLIQINTLEESGDQLYHKAVRTLFDDHSDLLEIIKWREIFEIMESCCDACEDVADMIESVIMKNS